MKQRHIEIRIQQCLALAGASHCPRRKLAALLLDPKRNVILADGYNGGPRGANGTLCRGFWCERDGVTMDDLEIRVSWTYPPLRGGGTHSVKGMGVFPKSPEGVPDSEALHWESLHNITEKLEPGHAKRKAEEWAQEFVAQHPPIESGTRMERGCHHAEMNVICNAAANGVATKGAWLIVTGEPCLMCAKLIHHADITRVVVVDGGFGGQNGVPYLEQHSVEVQRTEGPKDPRFQ